MAKHDDVEGRRHGYGQRKDNDGVEEGYGRLSQHLGEVEVQAPIEEDDQQRRGIGARNNPDKDDTDKKWTISCNQKKTKKNTTLKKKIQ